MGNALRATDDDAISQERVEERERHWEHFDTVTARCILQFFH